MSDKEFERYLKLLGDLLGMSRRQRDVISAELRDHFDNRLADLLASSVNREEAIQQALSEFGDVAGLAHQFLDLAHVRSRKKLVRTATFSTGLVAIAILLLFAMWPENARVPMTQTTVAQAVPALPTTAENAGDRKANDDLDDVADTEADQEVWKKLSEPTELEFLDTPLKEVIEFIQTKHKMEVFVDRASLEGAGIGEDTPVTQNLRGIALQSALNLILENLETDWYVDDGAIVIATASDVQNTLRTRVYDVNDLLQIADETTTSNGNQLIRLLQRHTGGRHGGWADEGGVGTVLRTVGGVLVVRHSPKAHVEIQGFLKSLQKVRETSALKDSQKYIATKAESTAESLIHKSLASKGDEFQFVDTPLRDVVDFIKQSARIPLEIDRRALSQEGMDPDLTISFARKAGYTLGTTLNGRIR